VEFQGTSSLEKEVPKIQSLHVVWTIVTWNGDRSGIGSRYRIAVRYFSKSDPNPVRLETTIGNDAYGFRFAIPGDPDRNRTAIRNDRTRLEIAKGLPITETMVWTTPK
ncbi:hypothetical protein Tco_0903324, partial [Tanacetum coccineum]